MIASTINRALQASHKIISILEEASSHSEMILDLLPGIFLVVNEKCEILRCNIESSKIAGVPIEEMLRRDVSSLFKEEMWEIFASNVKQLRESGKNIDSIQFELAISTPGERFSGKPYFWILSRFKNHPIEGQIFTVIGEDISELRESEKKLLDIFSGIPLGILTINEDGLIEGSYSSYLRVLLNSYNFTGRSLREVVFDPVENKMSQIEKQGVSNIFEVLGKEEFLFDSLAHTFPKQIIFPTESEEHPNKWLKLSYQPVCYGGIVRRILIIIENKTAVVQASQRIENAKLIEEQSYAVYQRVIRDPLTGLFTRFYLNDTAPRIINNFNRGVFGFLFIVVFSIDDLNQINARYGNLERDKILKRFADLIQQEIRETDIPVRFGSEEFLVLYPSNYSNEEAGFIFAERIRKSFEAFPIEIQNNTEQFTISSGISLYREKVSFEELVESAREQLQKAKQEGGNRILQSTTVSGKKSNK